MKKGLATDVKRAHIVRLFCLYTAFQLLKSPKRAIYNYPDAKNYAACRGCVRANTLYGLPRGTEVGIVSMVRETHLNVVSSRWKSVKRRDYDSLVDHQLRSTQLVVEQGLEILTALLRQFFCRSVGVFKTLPLSKTTRPSPKNVAATCYLRHALYTYTCT